MKYECEKIIRCENGSDFKINDVVSVTYCVGRGGMCTAVGRIVEMGSEKLRLDESSEYHARYINIPIADIDIIEEV